MKTLVTGGAGFIGSHLVEQLLKDGHTVVVLDNFSTGRPENLKQLTKFKKLKLVPLDISDYRINLNQYLMKVDWVFHLAALADIVPSIVNPKIYHRVNVDGTVNMLIAAHSAGVKKFVYAASASCYGIPKKFPTPETTPVHPQYPYALTKYIGEQYTLHWGKVYQLPVVSLRLFNVYGPRSRTSGTYGAVFGIFLAQKLAEKSFTIVGDGTQTRDFTYVTDVTNAFVMAAKSKVVNEIFNVGTGQPQSVNKLVRLLGGTTTHIPKRPAEPDKTQADIRKIKRLLNWKPAVSFETGVQQLLTQIDYWNTAPVWTPAKIETATRDWFKYLK
ncbi:MAG: dehydratase-like protein [Candidatus Gottesmanbacteria bacterium GW2011_GWA1_43_11]|uniref:Dehydratase-like protein n=1 Tax=Candidatus Gottesmanbacteria bacterium GW2011_GWA1_43_11 TaxID=1618436 RepID=A0A0G1CIX6_9BACT|nr:MAG: dehydratase-like protein [Candidatus Gottesmanbacteria bacterium GW2011_GWA1_43_11]